MNPDATAAAQATRTLLSVRDLISGYGRVRTLHGVDADVPEGKITAIIGPNGSGKSTLLKALAGLLRTWDGRVEFDGNDITGITAHQLVHNGICMVPQGRVVFPALTVEENLKLSAYTVNDKNVVKERLEETYALFPVLRERKGNLAGSLSGGEQVLLSIGKVPMLKPKMLLIDEPSLGLSPKMMGQVYEKIQELARGGLTVLVVEQNVRKALEIADTIIVLVLGNVRYVGTPQEIERDVDLGTLFIEGKL
ncbi:ABC transporter ATP-binding protein [Leucobacter celer]|uniref:ABC transporter ATP-binding protein n=1 Tax=Leucobacter celer TaxID=668625 RepID=UPI0006A78800|nr:ABC transporter ATP-binding protein [Leucobacter celer]